MPTNKPSIRVHFEDEQEKEYFKERADKNERSMSNEFRVAADLPELQAGGVRENAGRKKLKKSNK